MKNTNEITLEFNTNLEMVCWAAKSQYSKEQIYKAKKELQKRFDGKKEFVKLSHVTMVELSKIFIDILNTVR